MIRTSTHWAWLNQKPDSQPRFPRQKQANLLKRLQFSKKTPFVDGLAHEAGSRELTEKEGGGNERTTEGERKKEGAKERGGA